MSKSIKFNAILNMLKQIMQVIFPLITIPYITRVLLPENYGKINTGNAMISYISLIAGLGVASYAIREGSILRNDNEKLNNFSCQVFSINIVSTVFSYVVFAGVIFLIPHYRDYWLLLLIQCVSVLFTTIGADWINTIEEDYLYLTIRYIVFHFFSIILMFIFVKKPEDYYVYAAITLVTSVGPNLFNVFYIRRYIKIHFTFQIEWKKHLPPILVLFGNAVAITIYVSSDITMLEIFKGASEVGIYTVSTKIYSIIKQILNALLVVSIPQMTASLWNNDRKSYLELGKKILSALITIMIPLVIGIIAFRNEAILLAGGTVYLSAGSSLLILSFAVFAALLATFFSSCVMIPLRKEKVILAGTVFSAIINVVLNLFFIPALGSNGAAVTTLISEVFVATVFGYLVWKEGFHFLDKRVLLMSIVGGAIVFADCMLLKKVFRSFYLSFGLSFLTSGILFLMVQILGKNTIAIELMPRFCKKWHSRF